MEFGFRKRTFTGYNSIIKPLSEKSRYSNCETKQSFYLKNNNKMMVRHGTEESIE